MPITNTDNLLEKVTIGFQSLQVADSYKTSALKNLNEWLSNGNYLDYLPQITDLIEREKWDLLLDSFYQVIPFGTGGRRGLVGIGPNRINIATIQSSAQGHSQYLLQQYGEAAKSRGVIIAFDVRAYLLTGVYNDNIPNPVKGLDCKTLAEKAAEVYVGNGIKVHLFRNFASTPELSFSVRKLKAVAGDMISASHNPPEYNGKKVVNETGGQLIPPDDEILVDIVVKEVKEIKKLPLAEAETNGLLHFIEDQERGDYIQIVKNVSLNSDFRSAKILFSPFHGTAFTSTYPVLKSLNFAVTMDEASGKPDPKFSSIVFNIPNPEVREAYINLMPNADKIGADIILVTDPDGDRIGLMSKEKDGWRFFDGNEIFTLATAYLLEEKQRQGVLKESNLIIKTAVTTGAISKLAEKYKVRIISDLLVGIKYITDEMNKLERTGDIKDFLIGGEESHGSVAGNYIRDKDSCVPAILISELASREKDKGNTLGQYLTKIYQEIGYFKNYLTEMRLPGAEGMSRINQIQDTLRRDKPMQIGDLEVLSIRDRYQGSEFLSETDKVSRNVLIFNFKVDPQYFTHAQVTIRPSGTEPKSKFYIEIGCQADLKLANTEIVKLAEDLKFQIEKAVLKYSYKIIGIDFPDRGFLLFWQLPVDQKMKYFEIEPEIATLKNLPIAQRKEQLLQLLSYLGSDPIEKVDKAFIAEYGSSIRNYLEI